MDVIKKLKPSPAISQPTDYSALQDLLDPVLSAYLHEHLTTLQPTPMRLAVALSGGVDSASLAIHLAYWARAFGIEVHGFHVHHGLQESASNWAEHVSVLAQQLGLRHHVAYVNVDLAGGDGIESAARNARYEAFTLLAAQHGIHHILVAHHQDDQAETVLMRLLRGAGPTGLSAMSPTSQRNDIYYHRPWLDVARSRIVAFAKRYATATGWTPVSDPTNLNDAYTRGAVRERLTPHLNARWPGWQRIVARHARQSRELAVLLDDVAQADLDTLDYCEQSHSFSLAAWRTLNPVRQAVVLRYWLAKRGQRAPTDARLADMMRQMRQLHALGFDRQMKVKHGQVYVLCTQGRVRMQQIDGAD